MQNYKLRHHWVQCQTLCLKKHQLWNGNTKQCHVRCNRI